MRAILKDDVIIKLVDSKSDHGVEIGDLPLGTPLDLHRIRWNGTVIVDLMTFDEIYVRRTNNVWSVHCIQVDGSQLVTMEYHQRKWLIDDAGTYRILTVEEVVERKEAKQAFTLDNRRLRGQLKEMVQDMTFDKIDIHIDNVFGNLDTAQKNSLKKLYKVVLALGKKQLRERH
jgi:hypothetical protein